MDLENLSLATIRKRRQEIAAEDAILADIESKLTELAARYASLATPKPNEAPQPAVASVVVRHRERPKRTKNALIIEALDKPRPLWQTANDIRDYLSQRLGRDVPMSSVSPELTNLKNSGTIIRNDLNVALALRVEDEEPSIFKGNGEANASPETDRD